MTKSLDFIPTKDWSVRFFFCLPQAFLILVVPNSFKLYEFIFSYIMSDLLLKLIIGDIADIVEVKDIKVVEAS